MTTEIRNSYLMWVGTEHYSTIKDWTDEAIAQGVSKRLPNADVAQKLVEPGTVIFVAHDEGEHTECQACLGSIECPDCRKRLAEIDRLDAAKDELELSEDVADAKVAAKLARLDALILKLNVAREECATCGSLGDLKGGTGGVVKVDGEVWDHRKYNYWLHQPKLWNPADHKVEQTMCEACGGTGLLPEGKVFGLFIPSRVEYILKEGDAAEVKAKMEARAFAIVPEAAVEVEVKRGCGYRKPGGVYLVTDVKADATAVQDIIKQLVESGAVDPEGVEVNGNFVRFLKPISIDAKRFRGVKKWSLDPEAEEQAEMIMEAMA